MRKVSELITDIRFATNESNEVRFPDARIISFLNRAQSQIEIIGHSSNPDLCFLEKTRVYDPSLGEQKLPSDMLGTNSISSVKIQGGSFVDRINYREQNSFAGYYVHNGKIGFSGVSDLIEVNYSAKIPMLLTVNDTSYLPDICEGFLIDYVERKINAINSSSDTSTSNAFTKEEIEQISTLLSDNSTDIKYPVIINDDYVTW